MSLASGAKLGTYEIPSAQGGMGEAITLTTGSMHYERAPRFTAVILAVGVMMFSAGPIVRTPHLRTRGAKAQRFAGRAG